MIFEVSISGVLRTELPEHTTKKTYLSTPLGRIAPEDSDPADSAGPGGAAPRRATGAPRQHGPGLGDV